MKVLFEDGWLEHGCPGCGHRHTVPVDGSGGHTWKWNGSTDNATLTPSVRHYYTKDGQEITTCHYFITDGNIQFCGDSRHALAGKTVPLPDMEKKVDDNKEEKAVETKVKKKAKSEGSVNWDKPIQFENGEPCEYVGMAEEEHFADTPRIIRRTGHGLEEHHRLWYMPEDGSHPMPGYNVMNAPAKKDDAE